jgi:hypothetical protein
MCSEKRYFRFQANQAPQIMDFGIILGTLKPPNPTNVFQFGHSSLLFASILFVCSSKNVSLALPLRRTLSWCPKGLLALGAIDGQAGSLHYVGFKVPLFELHCTFISSVTFIWSVTRSLRDEEERHCCRVT